MSKTVCHAKIMLLGLWKCNFDTKNENPTNCILHHKRISLGFPANGSYRDWYEWVMSLSDEQAETIYGEHMYCSKCKESLLKQFIKPEKPYE